MHDMAVSCRTAARCGKMIQDLEGVAQMCEAIEVLAKDMAEMKKALENG